jgi:hypothetical protein
MSATFGSYRATADSPYAAAFTAVIEQSVAGLANAGDPGEVARAIDGCIRATDPPARIVVGADAEEMEKTMRAATPEGLAKLLREFVAGLTA